MFYELGMGMNGNVCNISGQSATAENPLSSCVCCKQIFDSLPEGIFIVNKERRIIYWNLGAREITGYSREETIGRYCHSGVFEHTDGAGCRLCEGDCPMLKVMETDQVQHNRVLFRHKDHRRIAVFLDSMSLKNESGEIIGAVGAFRDASEAAALDDAYDKLYALSEKDLLTGTVNRRQLDKLISDQLGLLNRSGISFSLVLLNIDHFRLIKHSLGLEEADETAIRFAQLLRRQCRRSDIIGRFSERSFLVLLRRHNLQHATQIAERMRIAVSTSGRLYRHVTASFGVVEAACDDTPASLLKRLVCALHHAKNCGGNRVESVKSAAIA
jgi:diguanylate cyclase (GGDEF)-like protein/PAS domain S-box-containing protein